MNPLSPAQIKKLKSILELSLKIERQSSDSSFDPSLLKQLEQELHSLAGEDQLEFQKLSAIPQHFSATMTLRHFANLLIPIERLLDRSLRDDDFLTQTTDQPQKDRVLRPLYFVLDNIRSAFNVGSIFRLADCVGATEILLCGYTPMATQEAVLKTSLSSTQFVNHRYFEQTENALHYLRDQGVRIIALETAQPSISLFSKPVIGPTAFLVGNERFGLNYSLLKSVDEIRQIPMFGVKNSLNVAQALSVAAFEWSRQN